MSDPPRPIKPAFFVGSSKKDLRAFPDGARSEIGLSIFEAQLGRHPSNAKPFKGFNGVLEIRDNFDGDTFRAVYTIRFEGVVYILHAFQKKTTTGISTPQRHIELIRQRLRDADAMHKVMKETDNER